MPQDYTNFPEFRISFPHEYVAHVEINRPKKLNSFAPDMWDTLRRIFVQLSTDPDVRVVVLSGAGEKAFTAGLDVQSASTSGPLAPSSSSSEGETDPARKAFALYSFIGAIQSSVTAIEKCTKPVISLMHGYAYGAAIDISSATDIRLAARDTRFSVKEVDIGLAADVGTLSRLPKLGVNLSWVKEVSYTARVFDANEALAVGLVSEVLGSKEEGIKRAMGIALDIAGKSPVAVQGTKRLIDYSRDHAISDGLDYTAVWNAGMLQTVDVQKALLSGLRKDKGGNKVRYEKL